MRGDRWIGQGAYLLVAESRHETKWGEHFHPLFEKRRSLADGLFFGIRHVKHQPDDQVGAQLSFAAVAGQRLLPGHDGLRRSATAGCPAADNALDAVPSHKIQATLARADNR